ILDNGQYLVLCTRKEQTELLSQALYVEIDMAFKRVHGITNEWEICAYANRYQKKFGQYLHSKYSHLLCEEYLKHIYKLCQVHFNQNIRNKAVSDETKELMYSITKLDTKEQVLNVLEKIKESGEQEAT
ncbi:13979_t:CDS:2, partial [Racocetra persica]